jgi:hypothetical protein
MKSGVSLAVNRVREGEEREERSTRGVEKYHEAQDSFEEDERAREGQEDFERGYIS